MNGNARAAMTDPVIVARIVGEIEEAQRAYDEALAAYKLAVSTLSDAKARLQALDADQRAAERAGRWAVVSDRDRDVWERRQRGETYAAIAKAHGISVSRATEILRRAERKMGVHRG